MNRTVWQALCLTCLGLALRCGLGEVQADDPPATDKPVKSAAPGPQETGPQETAESQLQKVLERLSRVERELDLLRVKEGKVPVDKKDQRVIAMLESPCLGTQYVGANNSTRFLAAKVLFLNLTPEKLTLKREEIELNADGQTWLVKEPPGQLQFHSIHTGQQTIQLRELKTPKVLNVAPAGTASTWIVFPTLPAGNHVPQMTLKFKLGEYTPIIDVNASQRDLLALKAERIGPRSSLGLLTVAGVLNTVNVGTLVEELDELSGDRVARVVIHFADSAAISDPQLSSWLQTMTTAAGRQQGGDTQFPMIHATIRELHLAALPGDQNGGNGGDVTNTPNIHKTDADAVLAALQTAYETIPRDELLQAIQSGSRLERAAALSGGGGRLGSDKLPVILKFADDNDVILQQAALSALSHFGDAEAIEKLLAYTHKNVEPLSTTAISSLAGSRYAAAHTALLGILNNEMPESKKRILKILARYPRPIWSDAIYQFVKDPRAGLNLEALNALVQVGHPKLISVLEEALRGIDAQLKQHAFNILAGRQDQESEDIAMKFTLEELAKAPATQPMLTLLNRVKDKRALPLLLNQFDGSTNKSSLIQTLAVLGDEETAKRLAEKYAALQNHEKGEALRALNKLKSPKFRELASQALLSSDSSLVGFAVQGLQEDSGPEAVRILIEALEKSGNAYAWSYLCNALAVLGTPDARLALIKARDAGNQEKRNYAIGALTQIRQRSPGFQYVYQAQALGRQKKWKEAIEQYSLAIQLDPQLPDAYAERANAYLMEEKYQEAGKDYEKAFDLDPFNSAALTGMCIVMVITDGKYAEAVKRVEEGRPKFPNNALFSYNTACVYGRSVEYLKKHEKVENRDALIKQYTATALSDLHKSAELGFRDFNWYKNDPDLKSLHEAPEFQKLVAQPEQQEETAPPEGNDETEDEEAQ